MWGVFLLLWALSLFGWFLREFKHREASSKADHAKCIALISSVVSNRVVAMAFRDAAARWDSLEEQANLRTLANTVYQPGGPSMPVIWLNAEADKLDPLPVSGNTPTKEARR